MSAADQIKIVCKSGTQKHTEERYRAVGGTLPCKDQLTQRAATGQYRCKTDNVANLIILEPAQLELKKLQFFT